MRRPRLLLTIACVTLAAPPLRAQAAGSVTQERADFTTWLGSAPFSPYAAIAVQPVGPGITIGGEPADIPLPGVGRVQVVEAAGGLVLVRGTERRPMPQGRPVPLGPYRLVADGQKGRRFVIAYGEVRNAAPPGYFPPAGTWRYVVELTAPTRRGSFRTLGLDGIETEAEEIGLAPIPVAGHLVPLRVYRMGAADAEDAELMIFFRDSTSAHGTYPAGRFLPLEPAGTGRYTVDFNRARNPFCAYSTVFPCPAPWPGNTLPATVTAGEKYTAH